MPANSLIMPWPRSSNGNWAKPSTSRNRPATGHAPELTAEQLDYAAGDAAVLLPLAEALRGKALGRKVEAVVELEMRCGVPVAHGRQRRGVRHRVVAGPRRDRRRTPDRTLAARMDAGAANPNCLPGLSGWNWNSNAGDVPRAFAALNVPLADTKEETLAGIDHPLARLLLDYREAAKRAGTYGREWVAGTR